MRSFLLAACLLICLACATPFPIDSLEEGMTTDEIRQAFGEPENILDDKIWIYTHEELDWFPREELGRFPSTPDDDLVKVNKTRVYLHFEGESLARWRVGPLGPQGIEKTIVAIKVTLRGLSGWLSRSNWTPAIYFARLEAGGQHHQSQSHLLISNYWSNGYAYLVNASPGQYAVIGARNDYYDSYDMDLAHCGGPSPSLCYSGSTYWFFPESMIDETIVTVEPSGVAFMGEFEVSGNLGFDDSDDRQKGYSNLLSLSGYARENPILKLIERPPVTSVRFIAEYQKDQSKMATQRFLQSSQSLAELGWRSVIERASVEDGDNKETSEQSDR